jgi:hypothetical protein
MNDPLGIVLRAFVAALEELQIVYYIGGSVASMTYGEYRQTADADLIADIGTEHIKPLVERLSGEFVIEESVVQEAVRRRSSFNAIHLTEFFKVDVFPLKKRAYDQEVVRRRLRETLELEPTVEAFLATPEDIVLAKMEWFRLGSETSERQWRDILGVLKVNVFDIDTEYLEHWAKELRIDDLLARAFDESGITNEQGQQ